MRRLTGDPVKVELWFAEAGANQAFPLDDYNVVKITRTPVECNEADIEALRPHGFSTEDIYDIINTAAIYNFNNRVASAAGFIPDRAFHGTFREEKPKRD